MATTALQSVPLVRSFYLTSPLGLAHTTLSATNPHRAEASSAGAQQQPLLAEPLLQPSFAESLWQLLRQELAASEGLPLRASPLARAQQAGASLLAVHCQACWQKGVLAPELWASGSSPAKDLFAAGLALIGVPAAGELQAALPWSQQLPVLRQAKSAALGHFLLLPLVARALPETDPEVVLMLAESFAHS